MAQGAVAKLGAGEGMDWFDLLERFQTAIATSIAAVLGFGGIILTIRSNAKLARKERHEIRTQEKQALIAVLHSELDVINDRLNNHLAAVEELKIEEGIVSYNSRFSPCLRCMFIAIGPPTKRDNYEDGSCIF